MNNKTEKEAKQAERDTEAARASGAIRTGASSPEGTEAHERNKENAGFDQTKGPDGKATHKAKSFGVPDDDVRTAISAAFEGFKGKTDKSQVVGILRSLADQLNFSGSWERPADTLDYDPDDLDDPRANPLGARPAPRGATRADEHTAMEPDSMGNIVDRAAAKAGVAKESADVDESVPPPDRDAVAAKRGMETSVEQYGTAGGSPLSRAEHKDDPRPNLKK